MKECDVCRKEFQRLHSTLSISGYGDRESYEMCTDCTKEIKHLVRNNMGVDTE